MFFIFRFRYRYRSRYRSRSRYHFRSILCLEDIKEVGHLDDNGSMV